MKGVAVARGAATIVNGIATGMGAAFGIDLWTEARVELTQEAGVVEGKIISDPEESTILIEKCVEVLFNRFGIRDLGARVITNSNIPIARGLKSSSVAANAITLAILSALGERLSDFEILNLAVDAAIKAGTTITGAFDDASASFFGNVIITDNFQRRILKTFEVEDLFVVIAVPEKKSYTMKSNVRRMKLISKQALEAHEKALAGKYWDAMILNSLAYSAALGHPAEATIDALEAGAVAAGLSGKGPAIVAVTHRDALVSVKSALERYGKIIIAKTNKENARSWANQ